jgi:hypothetical protein
MSYNNLWQALRNEDGDVEMASGEMKPLFSRNNSGYIVTNANSPVFYQSTTVNKNNNIPSSSNREYKAVPRLLDRNRGLHQSTGKFYVKKRIQQREWYTLYGYDWFHSLVDAPTSRIIAILLLFYITIVSIFGAIYYWIQTTYDCEMEFDSFLGAFDFSLEVMATFGFSIIIDQCVITSVSVLAQSCIRLIVEAVTIGVLYSRFARPSSRASTVLFSNNAVIRRIRGKLYFMFQLCELRKHQLVEAHVRLYLVKRENDSHASKGKSRTNESSQGTESFIQTCSMRLNHPNDELGSMLLLMMPQVVVHELDSSSPLMPPPVWFPNHPKKEDLHSQKREMIRWNPPVYRKFVRATQSAGHETFGGNDKNAQWEYDAEMLSNLAYPNVHRRGADIEGNVPSATPIPPPLQQFGRQYHAHSSSENNLPILKTPLKSNKSNMPSTQSTNIDKRDDIKSSNISTFWQAAGVNTPVPISTPRPSGRTDMLSSKSVLQDQLLSPGLEKYEGYLQSVTSSSSSAIASDNAQLAGLRQRKPLIATKDGKEDITAYQLSIDVNDEEDMSNSEAIQKRKQPVSANNVIKSAGGKVLSLQNQKLQRQSNDNDCFGISYQADSEEEQKSSEDEEEINNSFATEPLWQREEREMVQRYLRDRQIEIIAVVEGVDAATGGNVQARHSYVVDELAWNKSFAYSIYEDTEDHLPTVDFAMFHELIDAPTDAAFCGPISSAM